MKKNGTNYLKLASCQFLSSGVLGFDLCRPAMANYCKASYSSARGTFQFFHFALCTSILKCAIGYAVNKTYSTAEAAKHVGVNRVTLQRWLIAGKVKEPKKVRAGGVEARIWTDRDLERVQRYKQKHYRKGRGRRPKR
jgi:hypothetical protein